MDEPNLVEMHNKITSLAVDYEIDLVGDDGVVAMRDFRLMDVEHIIHELAHCTLFGIDVEQKDCMEKLAAIEADKPEYQQRLNEIEAFSVTMEVLRRLGAGDEVNELDFFASLEIAAYGFETPLPYIGIYGKGDRRTDRWVEDYVRRFHTTPRGNAAVHRLLNLFEGS